MSTSAFIFALMLLCFGYVTGVLSSVLIAMAVAKGALRMEDSAWRLVRERRAKEDLAAKPDGDT
jgi:hypothetical protein